MESWCCLYIYILVHSILLYHDYYIIFKESTEKIGDGGRVVVHAQRMLHEWGTLSTVFSSSSPSVHFLFCWLLILYYHGIIIIIIVVIIVIVTAHAQPANQKCEQAKLKKNCHIIVSSKMFVEWFRCEMMCVCSTMCTYNIFDMTGMPNITYNCIFFHLQMIHHTYHRFN